MSDNQETTNDIIAAMREEGHTGESSCLEWVRTKMRYYANRLEAAIRRERGNSAKLREALGKIRAELWNNTVIAGKRKFELYEIADAALAAPARNCDLPLVVDGPADNNADKAWLVFKRQNPHSYFDVSGLLRCIDWLFAPVTEQKGETDGNE